MADQWEQTDLIQMSVQTADLRFEPHQETPILFLSCGLVNIARGSCQLSVSAAELPANTRRRVAINADRPVMTGSIQVSEQQFERMIQSCLLPCTSSHACCAAEPTSSSLLEGFLFIDKNQTAEIVSLQINMPLK